MTFEETVLAGFLVDKLISVIERKGGGFERTKKCQDIIRKLWSVQGFVQEEYTKQKKGLT